MYASGSRICFEAVVRDSILNHDTAEDAVAPCHDLAPLARQRFLRIQTVSWPAVHPRPSALTSVLRGQEADLTEHAKLLSDAGTDLREVNSIDALLSSDMLDVLAKQRALRALTLRHVKTVDSDLSLDFLYWSKALEVLVLDDVSLTDGDFTPIMNLPMLRKLTLGLRDPSKLTPYFWANCSADVSLILYGAQNDGIKPLLAGVSNLTELSFRDFGEMKFPVWIRKAPNLETLSFNNGCLSSMPRVRHFRFSSALWRFSTLTCSIYPLALERILKNGSRLSELELALDCAFDSLNFKHCENLRVLKLQAEEFDGEALMQISNLQHLRELHFSGCLGLLPSHVSCLRPLRDLEKICISTSFVSPAACDALGLLEGLQDLTFECCFGLQLNALSGLTHLSSIKLNECPGFHTQLNDFFGGTMCQSLDSFSINF